MIFLVILFCVALVLILTVVFKLCRENPPPNYNFTSENLQQNPQKQYLAQKSIEPIPPQSPVFSPYPKNNKFGLRHPSKNPKVIF